MPTNRTARPAAADQFAKLGLTPADWTPAMGVAVKQKWTGLDVDAKVADLRERIEAQVRPTLDTIRAQHPGVDDDEATRLLRNAKVNAWRVRTRLQAALDARELRFAKMRAAKASAA